MAKVYAAGHLWDGSASPVDIFFCYFSLFLYFLALKQVTGGGWASLRSAKKYWMNIRYCLTLAHHIIFGLNKPKTCPNNGNCRQRTVVPYALFCGHNAILFILLFTLYTIIIHILHEVNAVIFVQI